MRDPYVSLAVPRSATVDEIKKSFRLLAKRLHPDANNDPKAAALFAEIKAAHEILGDEEKRRAFDRGEIDVEGKPTRQVIARHSRPSARHIVTRLMAAMIMLATSSTLIMRGLTPEEKVNASTSGENRGLSPVSTNQEHAPASPSELPDTAVQSEPRLILQHNLFYAADDGIPLGIQVDGKADGLALEISGLPNGTTISSGLQLTGGRWRILAADVGNAMIRPPAGFSGAIDLAIDLRRIDDTVVDRGSLHLESQQTATRAQGSIESAGMAAQEGSAVNPLTATAPTDQNTTRRLTHSQSDLIGRSEMLLSQGEAEAARLAQPKRHAVRPPTHLQRPTDVCYRVYVAGTRISPDPDPLMMPPAFIQ